VPLFGKEEVADFLKKFAEIKALKFVAERFSDGDRSCCFTWNVEIAGVSADAPKIRGISFYGLDGDGKIAYVRDIPESVSKPPPLQALAALLQPKLRIFQPRASVQDESAKPCNCAQAGEVSWPTGESVKGPMLLAQRITGADARPRTLSQEMGDTRGAVVIFLRHLG